MQKKLLEKLCCPFDKSDLQLTIILEEGDEIIEGLLTCPECNRYYPIVYGIPIMTPDEYRQKQLEIPILERWGLKMMDDEQSFVLDTSASQNKLHAPKDQ